MKIAIFRNKVKKSVQVAEDLEKLLLNEGFTLDFNHPDIVVSIGGDGTLLSAFRHFRYQLQSVRFVGINTGHLGFYTDWREYEIKEFVKFLKEEQGETIYYPILESTVHYYQTRNRRKILSLNEITIKNYVKTLKANVFIEGFLFEKYRGDGLCISTPTGSTGYNKSLWGSVIDPTLPSFQLTEIAPINNKSYRTLGSSAVFPKDIQLTIKPKFGQRLLLVSDGWNYPNQEIKRIDIAVSKQRIAFLGHSHAPFWKRVSEDFIDNETN